MSLSGVTPRPSSNDRRTVRAAVVQAAPVAFDVEAPLDRVSDLTDRAADGGAEPGRYRTDVLGFRIAHLRAGYFPAVTPWA